jgi:hypothetical protein
MAMQAKPRYPVTEPYYGVDWETIASTLTLAYTDTTGKTSKIIDQTLDVSEWTEPPDCKIGLVFPELNANLDNSWVRTGSEFKNTGVSIDADGIDQIYWRVFIKNPWSIRGVKWYNPFGYTCRARLVGFNAALDTEVGDELLFYVAKKSGLEYGSSQYVKSLKADGAVYLCLEFHIFHEDIADNNIEQLSTNDGFMLGFPDIEPKTQIPWGPSVSVDSYNLIDRYGKVGASIAGLTQGAMTARTALENASTIQAMAQTSGVPAATIAGVFALGLSCGWVDLADVLDYIVPASMVALPPAAASFMLARLPNKYYQLLGAGAGALGAGGAAYLLLQMIDDITVSVET